MSHRCPMCQGTALTKIEDHPPLFRCEKCKMLTDCEDDGDIGKRTGPERYAENKEEYKNRQRERLERQRKKR